MLFVHLKTGMHVIYLKRCFAGCIADEKSDRGLFREDLISLWKKTRHLGAKLPFPDQPLLPVASDGFFKKFTLEYRWHMSSPHALIIRRVRIEVRENWCQTSSFHSHPETKWHSDYGSQSEVPRLHMHRRDVFCNQSNQASPSCGSARIRVPDEPAPFSAGSLGGSTVWRWRMGCSVHYTAAVIQDSLVLWNTIISGDSGSVSQHTQTVVS